MRGAGDPCSRSEIPDPQRPAPGQLIVDWTARLSRSGPGTGNSPAGRSRHVGRLAESPSPLHGWILGAAVGLGAIGFGEVDGGAGGGGLTDDGAGAEGAGAGDGADSEPGAGDGSAALPARSRRAARPTARPAAARAPLNLVNGLIRGLLTCLPVRNVVPGHAKQAASNGAETSGPDPWSRCRADRAECWNARCPGSWPDHPAVSRRQAFQDLPGFWLSQQPKPRRITKPGRPA